MSNNWTKNIHIDLLSLPCALCGARCETRRPLCAACFAELPFLSASACRICALPISSQGQVCGRCLMCLPPYKKCIATFNYLEPVAHLIQCLKFHDKLAYALLLGSMMADSLVGQIDVLPDIIVPVPLHRTRLRERGYNQALELARPIAKHFGVPIDNKHCYRCRSTSIQSLLPADERHKNVEGAFRFSNIAKFNRVAIVDDVMTTGHTINALTNTLLRSGVKEVFVWVCARAPLH